MLLIMTVAKRWRQCKQFNTHLAHNFMSQSYSFPFVEFYHYISHDEKASYHWQKSTCLHQYDLWKFNEILWQRIIYDIFDILYVMKSIKMRSIWYQKYSPLIVGAREICYWRFQESLLAVKFHPPLFLFVLLVHVASCSLFLIH